MKGTDINLDSDIQLTVGQCKNPILAFFGKLKDDTKISFPECSFWREYMLDFDGLDFGNKGVLLCTKGDGRGVLVSKPQIIHIKQKDFDVFYAGETVIENGRVIGGAKGARGVK